jgi:hypothetical protein
MAGRYCLPGMVREQYRRLRQVHRLSPTQARTVVGTLLMAVNGGVR